MSMVYSLRKPQIFKYRQKLLSVSQAKPLNLLIPQVPRFTHKECYFKGVCVCRISGAVGQTKHRLLMSNARYLLNHSPV